MPLQETGKRNDFRRIGLYFKENYKQGELVDVSIDQNTWLEENSGKTFNFLNWYESRLEKFPPPPPKEKPPAKKANRKKPRKGQAMDRTGHPSSQHTDTGGHGDEDYDIIEGDHIIPPDSPDGKNPPRIRLREKGENGGSDVLHPGHMEFKVFLQKGIEDDMLGRASRSILHRKSSATKKEKQQVIETEERLVEWLIPIITYDGETKQSGHKRSRVTTLPNKERSQLDSLNAILRQKEPKSGHLEPNVGETITITTEDLLELQSADAEPPVDPDSIFGRITRETVRALISKSDDSFLDDDPKAAFRHWLVNIGDGEKRIRKFASEQEIGQSDEDEINDVIRGLVRYGDEVMPDARMEFGEIPEIEIFCAAHSLIKDLGERIARTLSDAIEDLFEITDSQGERPFEILQKKGKHFPEEYEKFLVHLKSEKEIAPDFGLRVRKFREAKGWGERDMAEKINVRLKDIQKIEGGTTPNDTLASKIEKLGVPLFTTKRKMTDDEKKLLRKKRKDFNNLVRNGFGGPKKETASMTTEVSAFKLAYNIVNILLEEEILGLGQMSERDILLNLFKNNNDKFSKWRQSNFSSNPSKLVFTEVLRDKIGDSDYRNFRSGDDPNAIYRTLRGNPKRWMYCPPEPHDTLQGDLRGMKKQRLRVLLQKSGERYSRRLVNLNRDELISRARSGGLLIKENRELVSKHADYKSLESPRCDVGRGTTDALNHLQEVQWEINLDFLGTFCDIHLDKGNNDREHTFINWNAKQSTISKIRAKKEFQDAFKANDSIKNEERANSLDWARRIIDHNANVFWHSWCCDFRGRMYPTCVQLSPVGDDFDRAMIRFKHWKQLGENGKKWLFIHTHNLMSGVIYSGLTEKAGKGEDFESREKWVEDNLPALRKMAQLLKSPSDTHEEREEVIKSLGLHEHSPGKSERFQRVAALLELDRIAEEGGEGDWSGVLSGQPIHLDGSCNGYQHVSCLLRDADLAAKVNVTIGNGAPQDLYELVASQAREDKGSDDGELHRIFSEDLKLGHDKAREAIKKLFSRNVTKSPTMTKVYGARDFRKSLHGRGGDGPPKWEAVRKSEEDWENQAIPKENIPEKVIQAYRNWKDYGTQTKEQPITAITNHFRRDEQRNLKKKFKEECKSSGFDDEKWTDVENALGEFTLVPAWAEGSSLYNALIAPGDEISKSLRGGKLKLDIREPRIEARITKITESALHDAIYEVTNDAFGKVKKTFKRLLEEYVNKKGKKHNKTTKLRWKDSFQWDPGDGFLVRNYYVYRVGSGVATRGRPTKRGSAYTTNLPEWYYKQNKLEKWKNLVTNKKSTARILEQCLRKGKVVSKAAAGDPITDNHSLWAKIHAEEPEERDDDDIDEFIHYYADYTTPRGNLVDIYLEEKWLDAEDASQIRGVRLHKDYSLPDFSKSELDNITDEAVMKVKSSIPPNFVHSLDSLHMRRTITRFLGDRETSGFWAVHDSFGTHPSDVDRMREIVRDEFKAIHQDYDLLDRIRPIAESAGLDIADMVLTYECQNSDILATYDKPNCSHQQHTKDDPGPCEACKKKYTEPHPVMNRKQRSLLTDAGKDGKKYGKQIYYEDGFKDTKEVKFDRILGKSSLDPSEIGTSQFLIN